MRFFTDCTPKSWEFGIGISLPTTIKTSIQTYTYNWTFYLMFGPCTLTLDLDDKEVDNSLVTKDE